MQSAARLLAVFQSVWIASISVKVPPESQCLKGRKLRKRISQINPSVFYLILASKINIKIRNFKKFIFIYNKRYLTAAVSDTE